MTYFDLGNGAFKVGHKLRIGTLDDRLFCTSFVFVHVGEIQAILFKNFGWRTLGQRFQLLDAFALRVSKNLELF